MNQPNKEKRANMFARLFAELSIAQKSRNARAIAHIKAQIADAGKTGKDCLAQLAR